MKIEFAGNDPEFAKEMLKDGLDVKFAMFLNIHSETKEKIAKLFSVFHTHSTVIHEICNAEQQLKLLGAGEVRGARVHKAIDLICRWGSMSCRQELGFDAPYPPEVADALLKELQDILRTQYPSQS